jgi:5-methylcytosine-specific restriction endonuclease McrA
MIAGIKSKSTREVQRFLAGYEPLTAVPADRVRVIVVPARVEASKVMPAATSSIVAPASPDDASIVVRSSRLDPSGQTTISADGKKSSTVEPSTSDSPPADRLQFERRARVEFTTHEELMTKLERIRSLMSHRLPINASLEELFQFMADYVLQREDPEARHEKREAKPARSNVNDAPASANARQIPAAVRDTVFVRDKRCRYVGPGGQRCESTHVLQIDHIRPIARGGASTIDNLRLLCAHHNRLESERVLGHSAAVLRPIQETHDDRG